MQKKEVSKEEIDQWYEQVNALLEKHVNDGIGKSNYYATHVDPFMGNTPGVPGYHAEQYERLSNFYLSLIS